MNFFKKLFGGKKEEGGPVEKLVRSTLDGLIEKGGFELEYDLSFGEDDKGEPQVVIEIKGADEEILKDREGQMIEAFQLFIKRVLQHNLPDDRTNVVIDSNGFQEETNQALIELADKLKDIVLEKGKPVYFRALSPKDRKVVHQYMANDQRVKCRSIGEGVYKKIKVYPIKSNGADASADAE